MAKSKSEIQAIILNDLVSIHNRRVELTKRLEENIQDNLACLRDVVTQLLQSSSGPFVAKTPKILRKKAIPRIETIPENKIFDGEISRSTVSLQSVDAEEQEASVLGGGRSKRNASKKAADNIKKQSFTIDKIKKDLNDQYDNTSSKRVSNNLYLFFVILVERYYIMYNFMNIRQRDKLQLRERSLQAVLMKMKILGAVVNIAK